MKGDLPAAALRLSCALPVHTHERIFYQSIQGSKTVPKIIVDGRVFRSRLAARQEFRIGSQTMESWLRTGKARYA